MSISIRMEHGPFLGISLTELRGRAKQFELALRIKKKEISILLTDDAHIRDLNRVYRKKDKATDVLAFAMTEAICKLPSTSLLGDVVISVETAARQAHLRNISVTDEITMLLAHGMLHLLGWDHDTPSKNTAMLNETNKLLALFPPASTPPASTKMSLSKSSPSKKVGKARKKGE